MDVRVCPVCASAKIDKVRSVGSDSEVACANCGWSGEYKEALEAGVKDRQILENIVSIGGDPLAMKIAEEVATTYFVFLAQYAGRPIGLALMESGVVGREDSKSLARLIKAACRGAHKATLDEIEKMQEELQDGQRPNPT